MRLLARTMFALGFLSAGGAAPSATPSTTQPTQPTTERVVSLLEAKADGQTKSFTEVAGLAVIESRRIDDVVKLSLKNKDLVLETTVTRTDDSVVRIPGIQGLSKVRVVGEEDASSHQFVMTQFYFENRDYSVSDAIAMHTSVSFAVGNLQVVQARETISDDADMVQLIQDRSPVRAEGERNITLHVQRTAEPPVNLHLTADNIVELRRKYPAEVAKYVDPMFRALHQEGLLARVDPRLAWQVFASAFEPTDELRAKVKSLIAQLDAGSFPQREAASRQLAEVGQPAALLLMRQDRKGLGDEQVSRIDAFLAGFRPVSDPEAERLRQDRDFLLDCLYSEEEPLRRHALAELRKVTGREIRFDVAADPEQRLAAIAKLREQVGDPTTRPSDGEPTGLQP